MKLVGQLTPPGDKSISHRLGLLSLLAQGRCEVGGFSPSADCASTLAAVAALGGGVERVGERVILSGAAGRLRPGQTIDCGNSGTTMRFLMGLLAGAGGRFVLDGDESLRGRPMERVAEPLRRMGARVECAAGGRPPVIIQGGGLRGGQFDLPVASAQLKSALLLAGLQADGPTTVNEPAASRDHTERLLAQWGAQIRRDGLSCTVWPGLLRLPAQIWTPADASAAAFFCCGAAILPGSRLVAQGVLLNENRLGWLRVLERMGGCVDVRRQGDDPEPWGDIGVEFSPELRAVEVGAAEIAAIIDEAPILALTASQCHGVSVFRQVGELRVKESDRLAAIIGQLGALGADLRAEGDDLIVRGPTPLRLPDAPLKSFGDHRIAMVLRVAGLLAGGWPRIDDEACMAISHPAFNDDLRRLAGMAS
ncbi:3-phosphoshikimate 1-carboxyvinyltransferase [Desulfarculus baarsii DSM 2075]|uniref:3-phosphoshikimate 1-carboxyvinyltransferase n=1 Tax=Desulfarculus baarsii (strain ATCC 33931 / DSM 2075 / LMG 7858 / VKM B-1802 / 2st14) TaxID=644282 RepID=E1QLY4_DESB2|nr:3-phosphoshikimate 1-carboxyvinyltransferase [Desulfarculus baarsii]ADK86569.1 3-phosphoshikimate 1-carboxyvinyltransferase [Desulfarculus baarsii DSM 2075]